MGELLGSRCRAIRRPAPPVDGNPETKMRASYCAVSGWQRFRSTKGRLVPSVRRCSALIAPPQSDFCRAITAANGSHSKSTAILDCADGVRRPPMFPGNARAPSMAFAAWGGFASFIAIFVLSACDQFAHTQGIVGMGLIGSFGATAVLVYGAPAAEFSRFRNVMYGHGLSAIIGVTAALLLGVEHPAAAATAVGAAVFLMHLTETTHPPGGATALIAVTGGERVYQLGYLYVFVPVLIGAFMMYGLAWLGRGAVRTRFELTQRPVDDG